MVASPASYVVPRGFEPAAPMPSVAAASSTRSDSCAPGLATGGLDADRAEAVAALLRALADPVRLRLYTRIAAAGGEACVCDLGDLGVSQPTVSHHLRKLREAGLIEGERRGNWVYYRALPPALEPVRDLLGEAPQLA